VTKPEPAAAYSPRPAAAQSSSVERRPITVMFCDLVGSTALVSRLDAEDWRDLVNAYLDEATKAVTGHGGHVLKRLGDGLMALFGYPRAQENDAERAVRAALMIQRALAELNERNVRSGVPELTARVGIGAGPVVVDAAGEVFGEAPNVAARVQALAEPGTVLITANVQRQIAGMFVAEDRGTHELKGVPAPIALYRIVRASGGRRFGARALTPLVGREEELDLLRRRWERAARGEGQLALVVGEPGIGKSRLVEEFRLKLGETAYTFVEWSSSQLLQNTPLHPIAEWGRQRFGGAETPARQRLADLENTLRLIGLDASEYAPLLAPLVDIPLPKECAAKLAPEELRPRQLAAMTTWVLAGARSQPVALAFEDLHWADPTSLDLMQALAERGRTAPLFIIATARPEFRPPWSLRSHHGVISLSPLDHADVAQMVGELAARHAFSKEVVEGVSERTGGVPLFVEEVARLLLERGEAGGLQAIPPTLQQSLAARLDRLGEAREVAQIGAVLGRDFTYSLLRAVGGVDDPVLQSALDKLASADLLIAEGVRQEASYRFKHALIQDAAYDSLLKSRRQALHRRAAEVLRDQPERAAAEPEVIGHHFTQAGLGDQAIEWWGKAGDQALRRSAFQEAIAHLGKAVAMADKGAVSEARGEAGSKGERKLPETITENYARAVMLGRGFSAPETSAAFARAREDAHASSPAKHFENAHAEWIRHFIGGDLSSAQVIAEAFVQDARTEHLTTELCVGLHMLGSTRLFRGQFLSARSDLELALNSCTDAADREARLRFAADPPAMAQIFLAIAQWHIGHVQEAVALSDMAMAAAEASNHPPTVATVRIWRVQLNLLCRKPDAVRADAEIVLALGREHGMPVYSAGGTAFLTWTRACVEHSARDVTSFRDAIRGLAEAHINVIAPLLQGLLAELELKSGRIRDALAAVDEALSLARENWRVSDDAFLHRLRGEILPKLEGPAAAEDAFQTALVVAKEQGARTYELHAALALARLYQSTGRTSDAHAVLAPALEGFAPTPEMPEIGEAQALLAALHGNDEIGAPDDADLTRHLDHNV
jgi:class 3 adenylate cyclase/tetratricopeptide (TPR) repeat protein